MKVSLRKVMKLSIFAAAVSIVATLPQIYSAFQTGKLRDHHPYSLILSLIANILLWVHGYRTKDLGILVLGAWFSFYNAVLVYFKLLRFDKERVNKEDDENSQYSNIKPVDNFLIFDR